MGDEKLEPLQGSERRPMTGFRPAGAVPGDDSVEVSVVLRPSTDAHEEAPPEARQASDADIEAVAAYARERGLSVVAQHPDRRTVVLQGPASAMQEAFGVTLERYTGPGGAEHRGRVGPLSVPQALADRVVAVLGLDDRPQARPFLRVRDERQSAHRHAAPSGYSPLEVAQLYNFPKDLDGTGVTVAIIELGGGYDEADLAKYFAEIGVQMPSITAVGVDGASNQPGRHKDIDAEVCLDIEIVGAVAPGARQVVYFAPNTDRGFYDAISAAVFDTVNKPSLVSISWGGPEVDWTEQAARAMDMLFADAGANGVTVLAASGDSGAPDGVTDGRLHTTFPASSPYALGCGGTRLVASTGVETVWNDIAGGDGATGGGISDIFDLPDYQTNAGVPPSANPGGRIGRGVPDVGGDADPITGYHVRVDGVDTVIGGTSAVAPLWAGLLARCIQALGRPLGFVHPRLYATSTSSGAFHDIMSGDNNGYSAGPGWDPCTGLGSPDGTALLSALGSAVPTAVSPGG